MPFLSESQRRLCYAMYNKDIKAGRSPRWDCKKWEKETGGKKLPIRVSRSPKPKKASKPIIRGSPKTIHRKGYGYTRGVEKIKVKPTVYRRSGCPTGTIIRKAYIRRLSSGKIIRVPAKCIQDQGKVGKGKKLFDVDKKISLRDYGYSMNASTRARHEAIKLAVSAHGKKPIESKLMKLTILFSNKPQASAVENDYQFVKKL